MKRFWVRRVFCILLTEGCGFNSFNTLCILLRLRLGVNQEFEIMRKGVCGQSMQALLPTCSFNNSSKAIRLAL